MANLFQRFIGIDYSGAETPEASLPGLRVYMAEGKISPVEVPPPPSPRKHWSRLEIAEWLKGILLEEQPTLVGIDHGFSFPEKYFVKHNLPRDWSHFLDDFHAHWPTDQKNTYVDFVRNGMLGNGTARSGNSRWRRITELRTKAKSVFHFDVPGSVAKSTHAGIPWLRYLRQNTQGRSHFWPFDGWKPPVGKSVIAEVYPALWKHSFSTQGRNLDQHDAYSIAAWLQRADNDGSLSVFFEPDLTPQERITAAFEGWIIGVA